MSVNMNDYMSTKITETDNGLRMDMTLEADKYAKAIAKEVEDDVLDRVARLKGYVKERTCTLKPLDDLVLFGECSACGAPVMFNSYRDKEQNFGLTRFCPSCGSRVVGDAK